MVTRPTWRLFGERGPEAVIPLHRAGQLGGGVSVSIGAVNVQAGGDLEGAADAAAARVRSAILRAGRDQMALKQRMRRGL